jgi:hypothetical protein
MDLVSTHPLTEMSTNQYQEYLLGLKAAAA